MNFMAFEKAFVSFELLESKQIIIVLQIRFFIIELRIPWNKPQLENNPCWTAKSLEILVHSTIGTGSSRKSNSVQAVEEAQQARIKFRALWIGIGLLLSRASGPCWKDSTDSGWKYTGTQWAGYGASGVLSENGEIFIGFGLVILLAQTRKSESKHLQPASVENTLRVWLTNFVNFLKAWVWRPLSLPWCL